MLRFLSKYLPRQTLNEMYKLYVRLHLDYGDVIYHIPHNICEYSQCCFNPIVVGLFDSAPYLTLDW